MKTPFSIVIVTKNASAMIGRLLDSVEGLSDDIVVCDTGSSDDTPEIAESKGVRLYRIPWEGYGPSKSKAAGFAAYDWVLSLDSDEKVDPELYEALNNWQPSNEHTVYQVHWKNFIGDWWIRHGGFGNDWKTRLFNRKKTGWDDAIIHEVVKIPDNGSCIRLPGYLEHYTHRDFREHFYKYWNGAMIMAESYQAAGKKSGVAKILLSPLFAFINGYFFQLGFLDGKRGWLIAVTRYFYTFMKYVRLYELNRESKQKTIA